MANANVNKEYYEVEISETEPMFKKTEFTGEVSTYNQNGEHKFTAIIPDPAQAEELGKLGFNVKQYIKANGDVTHFIDIFVSWRFKEPLVFMVLDGSKIKLDEEHVHELDKMTINKMRVKFTSSYWSKAGRSGIRAYLDVGYFYVERAKPADPWAEMVDAELENRSV